MQISSRVAVRESELQGRGLCVTGHIPDRTVFMAWSSSFRSRTAVGRAIVRVAETAEREVASRYRNHLPPASGPSTRSAAPDLFSLFLRLRPNAVRPHSLRPAPPLRLSQRLPSGRFRLLRPLSHHLLPPTRLTSPPSPSPDVRGPPRLPPPSCWLFLRISLPSPI